MTAQRALAGPLKRSRRELIRRDCSQTVWLKTSKSPFPLSLFSHNVDSDDRFEHFSMDRAQLVDIFA